MTKAEYISEFKSKLGTGILVAVEEDSEGKLTEIGGSRTFQSYRLACKAAGTNASGAMVASGVAHRFCVFDEGLPGEAALPAEQAFVNPAATAPSGSSLKNIASIFQSSELRSRVLGAMLKAAFGIKWEDAATAQHAARVALSGKVLLDPDKFLNAFMFTLATEAAIQSSGVGATDSAIQNLVDGWWSYIAQTQGLAS